MPVGLPSLRARTVVLVEGASDAGAVHAMAARRDRDLAAEGIAVVAMGGVTNIGRHLSAYGPPGQDLRLRGLYDEGEEHHVARALQRAGLTASTAREALAISGFHACVVDLEDELIRSLGVAAAERVIAEVGDDGPYRTFLRQPFHRDRPDQLRLRRFLGTTSGRKIGYAPLLVAALPPGREPAPLRALLTQL